MVTGVIAGALVLMLIASGCGGGGKNTGASARSAAVTTTKPPPPIAPLTGLPDPGGVANKRCAVTVKIDNRLEGHPKYGVEQADVIYEEVVEGGITRLAAIFNSHAPDRVGPVRSVRKTDQSIVTPIRGVFVYSGGAPYAIASINTAPVVQLDESTAGPLMFRDHSRLAPFNLYARVDQMYARCKDPAPPPIFTYRKAGTPVGGIPVASVLVGFLGSYAVRWTWDVPSATWKRRIFGAPEYSAAGTQLAPQNVVVMYANYVGGDPSHGNVGAEAVLTGVGKVEVFTAGREIVGTWRRPDRSKAATLVDAAGNEIALTPGQTWVELPQPSYTVTVTP